MKIALLSEKYTPDIGGLAISAARLGELLTSAGHEVRVFAPTTNLSASARQNAVTNKVRVLRFGAQKRVDDTLVDWFELIVEEHRHAPFDLLHAYFLPQAGFVAAYAGKYLGIPSVVSIRGNDVERAAFDPSKFSHVMYALQNASAVTTNASELARKAQAFINREIHLIPNGIDANVFKKVKRSAILAQALGVNDAAPADEAQEMRSPDATLFSTGTQKSKRPVIGFAGELRSKKGLSTLLIGYAQINKALPATLLIVGDVRAGEYQEAFEEFQRGNPDTHIIVTGYVAHKDMPAYYALMDVFAHVSLRDGMPNAVLEAMACELPVVATPVGGILDMMQDGINVKTVPVKDVNSFVSTTLHLLKDKDERSRIGKSARETVLERFTLEKELEGNLNVYTKV
jgi:glycosyltransferase involved in cell wall biosynthesis